MTEPARWFSMENAKGEKRLHLMTIDDESGVWRFICGRETKGLTVSDQIKYQNGNYVGPFCKQCLRRAPDREVEPLAELEELNGEDDNEDDGPDGGGSIRV